LLFFDLYAIKIAIAAKMKGIGLKPAYSEFVLFTIPRIAPSMESATPPSLAKVK
jgi:hypothetical protein